MPTPSAKHRYIDRLPRQSRRWFSNHTPRPKGRKSFFDSLNRICRYRKIPIDWYKCSPPVVAITIERSQKNSFSPNCTSRGLVPGAVDVTTPKFGLFAEQQIVLGGANCVRLNKLKTSVRNSRPSRSLLVNRILLNNAASKLLMPCERSRGSTRDSVPNSKSAGAAKHDVLNHSVKREVAFP